LQTLWGVRSQLSKKERYALLFFVEGHRLKQVFSAMAAAPVLWVMHNHSHIREMQ
jgi:hypothetical protein